MATKLSAPSQVFAGALWTPLWIDTQHFVAAAAETYTVPANVDLVLLVAHGAGFWLNAQAAATVPGADISDGTSSFFLPQNSSVLLEISPTTALSILPDAAATCNLNIWCYSRRHGA